MKTLISDKAAKLCDKDGGKCGRLRIITDDSFNVLWNSKNYAPEEIAFSDTTGKAPKDGAMFSVYVNGNCHSAECIAVNTDDGKFFIWTLCTAAENILRLGYTDTYKEVSFIMDTLKGKISDLAHLAEIMARENSGLKKSADEQIKICRDLTRYVKTLDEISGIIYGHVSCEKNLLILRETEDVVAACNRLINKKDRSIRLLVAQPELLKDMSIPGDRQIIDSALFSVIKRAVVSSKEKHHMLNISADRESVYFYIKYLTCDIQQKVSPEDFDCFAAKMYIEYLGGKMEIFSVGESEEIKIELPIRKKEKLLKCNTAVSEKELDRLAALYLDNII